MGRWDSAHQSGARSQTPGSQITLNTSLYSFQQMFIIVNMNIKAIARPLIFSFVVVTLAHNPVYIYLQTLISNVWLSLRSDTFPCQSAITCQWIPYSYLSLPGCYLVSPHHYNHPSWIPQLRYALWYCPSSLFSLPDGKNKILSHKQLEQAVNINGNSICFSLNRSCRLLIL